MKLAEVLLKASPISACCSHWYLEAARRSKSYSKTKEVLKIAQRRLSQMSWMTTWTFWQQEIWKMYWKPITKDVLLWTFKLQTKTKRETRGRWASKSRGLPINCSPGFSSSTRETITTLSRHWTWRWRSPNSHQMPPLASRSGEMKMIIWLQQLSSRNRLPDLEVDWWNPKYPSITAWRQTVRALWLQAKQTTSNNTFKKFQTYAFHQGNLKNQDLETKRPCKMLRNKGNRQRF